MQVGCRSRGIAAWSSSCARATEIARKLAGKPALYRALQKQTLNQRLRRRIVEGVPYGMALEALTAANLAYLTPSA